VNYNISNEADTIALTARQRRELMRKKKGTENSVSVDENSDNGELLTFTRLIKYA